MRLGSVVLSALLLLPPASVYAQSPKLADLVGAWLGTYDSLIVQPDSTFAWRLLRGDSGSTGQRFTRRLQAMKGDTIIFASAIRPDSYLVKLSDEVLTMTAIGGSNRWYSCPTAPSRKRVGAAAPKP